MYKVLAGILTLTVLVLVSCDTELIELEPSTGQLEFSRDTVFLDTVFTNTSSSTRSFKVYNRSSDNINIPSVRLQRGENSFYRLNVNGRSGKVFDNVELLARDSIYVFIEATVDFDAVSDPLYTDEILFDSGEREQSVDLVTLVRDAHFLFPERDAQGVTETIEIGTGPDGESIRVEGFYLDGNQVWTDDKPYVIYGFAGIDSGNILQIKKGVELFFHDSSGLLVEEGGRLVVEGTQDEKVVFQGDRLESLFQDVPGQWSTILLKKGSGPHRIEHAQIRNNTIGLLVDSSIAPAGYAMYLENTEIRNTSSYGLFARRTSVRGSNLLIANNGSASFAITGGGSHLVRHSTFANFWSREVRNLPAVIVSNDDGDGLGGGGGEESADLEQADFENCIIEGNQDIEFLLLKKEGSLFNFSFSNSLLRFDDPGGIFDDPLYDFDDTQYYRENFFNGNPDFLDYDSEDYRIGPQSDAISLGDQQVGQQVPFDLLGVDRRDDPDSGAYQHTE